MTWLAIGLVLASALIHATWNLFAKQSREPLLLFWGSTLVSTALYSPLALWLLLAHSIPPAGWAFVALTCALHLLYFWSLAQAYRHGDLSLVYPLARGMGPLLVPLLGAALLGERLAPLPGLGVALIVAGIVAIHLPALNRDGVRALLAAARGPGTRFAALTGLCIAAYSIADKQGVALVSPLLYVYLLHVGTAAGLTLLHRSWTVSQALARWKGHAWRVIAVGVLSPLAYGLALLALSFTPVSYVAPAREVSVVVAALFGRLFLGEPYGQQRLAGSSLIAIGLFLLVAG